jgi:hypothetical protein
MSNPIEPILLDDAGALNALELTLQELEWLVATRQLLPVTICGKRRFLYDNLRDLARAYQNIQQRA